MVPTTLHVPRARALIVKVRYPVLPGGRGGQRQAWRERANFWPSITRRDATLCCKRRGQQGEQQPCRGPSAFRTAHGGCDFARLLMRSQSRAMSQVLIAIVGSAGQAPWPPPLATIFGVAAPM